MCCRLTQTYCYQTKVNYYFLVTLWPKVFYSFYTTVNEWQMRMSSLLRFLSRVVLFSFSLTPSPLACLLGIHLYVRVSKLYPEFINLFMLAFNVMKNSKHNVYLNRPLEVVKVKKMYVIETAKQIKKPFILKPLLCQLKYSAIDIS